MNKIPKLVMSKQEPYLNLYKEYGPNYNPKYGDNRTCICGHEYIDHFDSYEAMYPDGCHVCFCGFFIEKEKKYGL